MNAHQAKLINDVLASMNHQPMNTYEQSVAQRMIDAQLEEAGMWDACDAADEVINERQQTAQVVRADAFNVERDSVPFAVGDVVFTRAFPKYVGVIVSIGHKGLLDTYRVRFEVLEGKRADVHADAYEHEIMFAPVEHDSVPCVPYEGLMSHTAVSLFHAVRERDYKTYTNPTKWAQWNDEARYLADVIIGGYDATIEA